MKTPILFLIFNRPETTARVFEEIKKAKPEKLFVAADGPRKSKEGEALLCEQARAIIKDVTWSCEVKTLFRDENLGCKIALSSAITWFFENVEEGIILEDDCVPSSSFFRYCELLLDVHRHDERIGMISGNNQIPDTALNLINPEYNHYYFVRPTYVWGWATWKRAWNKFDLDMNQWPEIKEKKHLYAIYPNRVASFFTSIFQMAYDGRATTWDPQWHLSSLLNNMLCVIPPRNLIKNIGFIGEHAVKKTELNDAPTYEIDVSKLVHPFFIYAHTDIEKLLFEITKVSKFSIRRVVVSLLEFFRLNGLVRRIYKKYNFKF